MHIMHADDDISFVQDQQSETDNGPKKKKGQHGQDAKGSGADEDSG